jgi:polysaccharide pyruvyl transferase WcaK-like protein
MGTRVARRGSDSKLKHLWLRIMMDIGKRPPKFLVVGCYGERNAGDEALLAALIHIIRSRWQSATLQVFSDDEVHTRALHGVESLPSVGLLRPKTFLKLLCSGMLMRIVRAIADADCLLIGGGELLRTDYGLWPMLTIFDRVLLAVLLGKPVLFLGVGASNLHPGLALCVMRYLSKYAVIMTRDAESVEILANKGIQGAIHGSDLSIALPEASASEKKPPRPFVTLSLLDMNRVAVRHSTIAKHDLLRGLADLADTVVKLGATPVFVPLCCNCKDDDRSFHREVVATMRHSQRAVILEEEMPPDQLKALIGSADLVIGMRLHACIFGLTSARPVLGISYHSKVERAMHAFGQDNFVVTLDRVHESSRVLEELWRIRSERCSLIAERRNAEIQRLNDALSVLPGSWTTTSPNSTVSVIIPTYNSASTIERAVQSARLQTCPPAEIIVIDDGSSDETKALITGKFGDSVRYLWQPNSGVSAARNKGVDLARSDWIAFLDADDYWEPRKLERQLELAAIRPDASLIACEAIVYDESGNCSHRLLPRPFNRAEVSHELKKRTVIPMGVLLQRQVFLSLGGFNTSLSCGEDRDLWARVAAHYEIAAIHEPLLYVTDRLESLSHDTQKVLQNGLRLNRLLCGEVTPRPRSVQWLTAKLRLRSADAAVYWSVASLCSEAGQLKSALRFLLKSYFLSPFEHPDKKLSLILALLKRAMREQ